MSSFWRAATDTDELQVTLCNVSSDLHGVLRNSDIRPARQCGSMYVRTYARENVQT